jgi:hypothetical protein
MHCVLILKPSSVNGKLLVALQLVAGGKEEGNPCPGVSSRTFTGVCDLSSETGV